jgi:hypothetical protein
MTAHGKNPGYIVRTPSAWAQAPRPSCMGKTADVQSHHRPRCPRSKVHCVSRQAIAVRSHVVRRVIAKDRAGGVLQDRYEDTEKRCASVGHAC